MTPLHAIAHVNHESAQVFQFGAEYVHESNIHKHMRPTQQHASGVRSQHKFYGEVCDAFDGIGEVLVVGGHTSLADFRHYVDKHRALTAKQIVDYQVVDHPTDNQLVALARKYFIKYDRMAGALYTT